jgi:Uma2 family endonuclease
MSIDESKYPLRRAYADAAQAYLRSLPLEHFMEAKPQATQREITVESLALVRGQRAEVQYFNEMLVQYPHGRQRKIRQVVPDNMVVLHPAPLDAVGSYDVPFQPAGPFWVLEYVSKSSERKDYEDSFRKYERELKVPYYLLFYPDTQDLTLFRHSGQRYVSVTPNAGRRLALPELDLELALLDGWVRFWYQGKLLPLPADLQRQLNKTRQQLRQSRKQNRQLQEQNQQAEERARQAEERARQAEERDAEKVRQIEVLQAKLRELGIEPLE